MLQFLLFKKFLLTLEFIIFNDVIYLSGVFSKRSALMKLLVKLACFSSPNRYLNA